MSEGNYQVILCERGVRTFADHTRNTLDLSMVPAVQRLSHLPIIVDPSHGTGKRNMVLPLARAAAAVGADGLMIEVHHQPDRALSDGAQSVYPEQFVTMMDEVAQIAAAVHRFFATWNHGRDCSRLTGFCCGGWPWVLLLALAGCRESVPDYPENYREYAYISNGGSNTVTVLDLVNMRQERVIAVGRRPFRHGRQPAPQRGLRGELAQRYGERHWTLKATPWRRRLRSNAGPTLSMWMRRAPGPTLPTRGRTMYPCSIWRRAARLA